MVGHSGFHLTPCVNGRDHASYWNTAPGNQLRLRFPDDRHRNGVRLFAYTVCESRAHPRPTMNCQCPPETNRVSTATHLPTGSFIQNTPTYHLHCDPNCSTFAVTGAKRLTVNGKNFSFEFSTKANPILEYIMTFGLQSVISDWKG